VFNVRDVPFQELVQDFSDMCIFSFVGTGISEWLDGAWRPVEHHTLYPYVP
jgi:hypothetical protein